MSDLWEGFKGVTTEQWQKAIVSELKGADYDDKMHWYSPEGIIVDPFYLSDFSKEHTTLPESQDTWNITAFIKVDDIPESNRKALTALEGGVSTILFDLDHQPLSSADIEHLIQGIHFNMANVLFTHVALPEMIDNILVSKNAEGSRILQSTVSERPKANSKISFLADLKTNSEENMVEELVTGIRQAHELLLSLMSLGLSAEEAVKRIFFFLSSGSRYLFEVAKIRALKLLWISLCGQYGVKLEEVNIIAESSTKKFIAESNTNMIRNTVQVMSAVLGGAKYIYAHPHHDDGDLNGFGERIARNIQHLLQQESHLFGMANVAQGSGFFESITQQLAEKAWDKFRAEQI